jgi:serine phosphatase RsbU (regulator of sigma subunit)
LFVIDPTNEKVAIVNAGHMAPIVRKGSDGSISEPGEEESGLPIAIDDGMEYESVEFTMDAGDLAVLYTDGINEAMNAKDEEFGMERVRQLTAEGGDAEAVNDRIVKAVLEHVGDTAPFDDMCLVVIERTNNAVKTEQAAIDTVDDGVIERVLEDGDRLH